VPAQRVEIRFPGTHQGFARAFARLREALDAERLEGASRYNAELVFEEIVANIVNHGAPDGHELDVRVTLEASRDSLSLTFDDNGIAFDPRRRTEALPPRSLDDDRIGGFGMLLVRRAASSLDYLRTAEGRNRLTVQLQHGGDAIPR